jgi:hypothetical protein
MKRIMLAVTALALCASASPAIAATVVDAEGDFIPGYTGPTTGDFDVKTFSVVYNPETQLFQITGTLFADINPEADAYYVVGVDTGAGAIAPFGSLGQPNVTFDQTVVVEGEGEAFTGMTDLDFLISGNMFTVSVPLSLLPSTGAVPLDYGFNLWPRTDLTPSNLAAISDFAPDNALLNPTAVPEPGTWGLMLFGFGAVGLSVRRARRKLQTQFA